MADTKISALTAVASVNGSDEFAVNDSGVSKKASGSQFSTFINANIILGASLVTNSQAITSLAGTDIELHSDNDLNVILGDAAGIDDFNVKDSANAVIASINSDGALTAVSYGGILEANLLDKSATESITGNWDFQHADGLKTDQIRPSTANGDITVDALDTAAGSTVFILNSDGGQTADLDVENDIIVGGVVDGRDIATDGTKLDTLTANQTTSNFTAGGTISAGDVVYMAANGKVIRADADDTDITKRILGISTEAKVLDQTVNILVNGVDSNQSGLTIGNSYYLDIVPGGIVDTAPSGSGAIVFQVGYALSTTTLIFQPQIIGVLN